MIDLHTAGHRRGVVCAPHAAAAEAGRAILGEGGNALEAMVAMAASIAAVYPHMNHLGGDGFWLVREPNRRVRAIMAAGPAGSLATSALYRQHETIPSRGPLAALTVPGAVVLTPRQHSDDRGMFCEWFRADLLAEATGRTLELAQANCSVSRQGVLRGVHFADVPPGQAKYVYCPHGALLDVVVDLRVGSPTFGQHETVLLDSDSYRAVYLSEGLGHAFCALEDNTVASYLCSTQYAPAIERTVNALDPVLGLPWPSDLAPILSERDAAAPSVAEAAEAGLLPKFAG